MLNGRAYLSISICASLSLVVSAAETPLRSRAELSNYEETSRYEDVLRFFKELQQRSQLVRMESFGVSHEGRSLPLVSLGTPRHLQPAQARSSGKPIVLLLANIHGGEVEGKEALQHLSRRLVLGELRPLLDKLIVLLVPIYNPDGNEQISWTNRPEQNGPVTGVGHRENAQHLDLNRDYMKLEAPETRALVALFNRWDPHLVVDLHTTDGSIHGYHLTYSIPLNPTVDPRLIAYHRQKLMPSLTKACLTEHQLRTYYYGNFARLTTNTAEPEQRAWRAFVPEPRVGQNYLGIRNRFTILAETFIYFDFRRRIEITEGFVEEILKYAAAHGDEIRDLTRRVDQETGSSRLVPVPQIGIAYRNTPLNNPVEILVGAVTNLTNPRSGSNMFAVIPGRITTTRLRDYGLYEAVRKVPIARAYLIPREDGLDDIVNNVRTHGIRIEELTAPFTGEVEQFVIRGIIKDPRSFQGHYEASLTGRYSKQSLTFPPGTFVVRTTQPLGTLAAYLLEPESEDGLVTWNFFDAYLRTNAPVPVHKLMRDSKLKTRVLK